jgi:hypothetical protein
MFSKPEILNGLSATSVQSASELLVQARTLKAQVLANSMPCQSAAEELTGATACLRQFSLEKFASEQSARAFWINIYNTLVIHGVLALEIRKRVFEEPAFFKKVSYQIGSQRFSLDVIEHGILRANRGHPMRMGCPQLWPFDGRRSLLLPLDPRIHFALNCGAKSCPPIRSYHSEDLDSQLELATRSFVSSNVSLHAKDSEIRLSKLFLWYASDFGRSWPQRLSWVAGYVFDQELAAALKKPDSWKRRFDDYDWRLA